MDNPELCEFVDTPRECRKVEYKTWLDLDDNETRANLARHLCALANYGGGYLVFGINDNMTSAGERPMDAKSYNHDTLSGIINRYLRPTFEISVYEVKSEITEILHPVVWVPSHEALPICSTRNGPDKKGKPAGITQGTHYTRAPGPESKAVDSPELWGPIIRRCIIHERNALLTGLEALLQAPRNLADESDAQLRRWHNAAHQRFLKLADVDPQADQLKRAHYQFSYQINFTETQQLNMATFLEHLQDMCHEVLDLVAPGWTMFWVFKESEFAPRSVTDPNLGETEMLECNLLKPAAIEFTLPDFWRVTTTGMATLIRPYREDRRDFGLRFEKGKWFWPYLMAREIAEVIRHARAFADRFEVADSVSFRFEWRGLQGRTLKDAKEPIRRYRGGPAQSDNQAFTRRVPVPHLTSHWANITAEILSRVMRAFDARQAVTSQQVLSWSKEFRPQAESLSYRR